MRLLTRRLASVTSSLLAAVTLTGFLAADLRATPVALDSVTWTQQGATPGTQLGGTWSAGSVSGTTAAMVNSGGVFEQYWGGLPFAYGYELSTDSSTVLGSVYNTFQTQTILFSSVVSSPYLFFNYTDKYTGFDFGSYSWELIGATYASRSGSSVVMNSSANNDDVSGFMVRINETFGPGTPLVFDFGDEDALSPDGGNTVGFTIGKIPGDPNPVPEIDPAGMGSVAAFVTGALGLLERRRRPKAA